LKIKIDQIDAAGLPLSLESSPADFPVLQEIARRGEATFCRPILFSLRVLRIEDLITVDGRFDSRARFACARCLADFEVALSAPVALTYALDMPDGRTAVDDDGIELSADEAGLIPVEGDTIELTDGLQEQIVMALPLRPLCRPDCKGLCPQCGADLNHEKCHCAPAPPDPRFAVLKNLKLPDK
jgi:uncharacterized protein